MSHNDPPPNVNRFFHGVTYFSFFRVPGPVVQSMVSLTSSLRGQLVKCFTTLLPNILIFFVEKNVRRFCNAKASHNFFTKLLAYFSY